MTLKREEVQEAILSYPPLQEYLGNNSKKTDECLRNINEMCADYSLKLLKTEMAAVGLILKRVYSKINISIPHHLNLQQISQKNNIIFVPNHRSHLDYISLLHCLHSEYNYQIPLHIAGGSNLNIFPIGKIFRQAGCFFIRRSHGHDLNYKLTFSGYLYHLLKKNIPIGFFFEGQRSRTGKMLPPRFGLFSMIIKIHHQLTREGHSSPLAFVPISIAHESVPEEKFLIQELRGREKKPENILQLLKNWKFIFKNFGDIDIKVREPIFINQKKVDPDNPQPTVFKLAFDCYRSVGSGLSITPAALLSLIILDHPKKVFSYYDILAQAEKILDYCREFKVPISRRLSHKPLKITLRKIIELFIQTHRIKVVENVQKNYRQEHYQVIQNHHQELLYHKNTILHHFLTPFFINSILINILQDKKKTFSEFKTLLREQRDIVKYEFYLLEFKKSVRKCFHIIQSILGKTKKEIESLENLMELKDEDLKKIARTIAPFSSTLNYIHESYYVGCLALKIFEQDRFNMENFLEMSKKIYSGTLKTAHPAPEQLQSCYSMPLFKNALRYYVSQDLLQIEDSYYRVTDFKKLEKLTHHLQRHLENHLSFTTQNP